MLCLHQLLICRNAWYTKLGYKPDFSDSSKLKYVIKVICGEIIVSQMYTSNYILAFPTEEIANKFKETFIDLIINAKELL